MLIKPKVVIGAKSKDGTGPLYPGCVYDVDDETAMRLVAKGVAVTDEIRIVPAPAAANPSENPIQGGNAPEGPSEGEHEIIDLEAMTYNELKAMAQGMGIETGKLKSKAAMIEAITQAMPGLPADDDLPDLTPQDVID